MWRRARDKVYDTENRIRDKRERGDEKAKERKDEC
jgi:hypothetical protein